MLVRYSPRNPGGTGIFSKLVRLWWTFVSQYHTYRWLIAQTVASRRVFLPRNEKRKGETAVITGGSRGIGAAVVRRLLQCDMHVIIGCRDRVATNRMIRSFRKKGITTGTVETISLDLISVNSIKEFAFKVLKKDLKVTVLINNAAIRSVGPYGLTVEGLEHHFQVNYLGHFLLTYMLLPKLNYGAEPGKYTRIVNVSSLEHYGAYPDLQDSQMTSFYSPEKAYMDTKLLLTTWNDFLDQKLQEIGANIRSYSVHPGFSKTAMWSNVTWADSLGGILQKAVFERKESCAEAIAYVALSGRFEGTGGLFLHNNEPMEPHPLCTDPKFQKKLWALSCKILNMEDNALAPVSDSDAVANQEEHEENNMNVDLEFLEEFHTTCAFKYEEYGTKHHDHGPEEEEVIVESQKSGYLFSLLMLPFNLIFASFKVKSNLSYKILKYFTFSLEEKKGMRVKGRTPSEIKPYYEYLINSLFSHWNLNKRSILFRQMEGLSIFLFRRLDQINSHFKLVQALVRSTD